MKLPGYISTSICVSGVFAQLTGPLVLTEQGEVIGTLISPSVRQFLGVPYAVANRWEAPKLPPTRRTPFHATEFGDSCFQLNNPVNVEFLKLSGIVLPNITESESCLSINVWAPDAPRKQKTAVMVWIHGGGFQIGTTSDPTYDGHFIVLENDDVIVPNAPQLQQPGTSQNFGLLDIDAAIQWVHDNIEAFGGDPNRIILFGPSAGSVAVDAYTFSHTDSTFVKGVIEHSGSISGDATYPFDLNPSAWKNVADVVGCGEISDADQLKCMREVPARTLELEIIRTNGYFGPVVDNITIFSDTGTRATSGNFLKVPFLVGSTQHEADTIVVGAQQLTSGVAPPFETELLADVQTQLVFTCPAGRTAQHRLNAGVPTWRYQYQGVFKDISQHPSLRAWHGADLPLVFGTYNQSHITNEPKTQEEIALSKYMQTAWVAFARDPQNGLTNFGWPGYSPTTTSIIQLGNFLNRGSATFGDTTITDMSCNKTQALAGIIEQVNLLLAP